MSWTDPPIFWPHEAQDLAIATITERLRYQLAAAERRLGVPPQTIEPLASVRPLVGNGTDIRADPLPCCQVGVFGLAGAPQRSGRDDTLSGGWILALQIVVAGVDREDTLQRRSVYAMAVAEIVLQWLPRHGAIDAVTLEDIDFSSGRAEIAGQENAIGEAQLTFEIHVPQLLSVVPPFNPDLPAGTPGGPPASDYVAPVPWPTANPVGIDVTRDAF